MFGYGNEVASKVGRERHDRTTVAGGEGEESTTTDEDKDR
jgi:hypothetical protein